MDVRDEQVHRDVVARGNVEFGQDGRFRPLQLGEVDGRIVEVVLVQAAAIFFGAAVATLVPVPAALGSFTVVAIGGCVVATGFSALASVFSPSSAVDSLSSSSSAPAGLNATDEIVELYRVNSEFGEEMTRYQTDHSRGETSPTEYLPPSCATMQSYGDCVNMDDLSERIPHDGVLRTAPRRRRGGRRGDRGPPPRGAQVDAEVDALFRDADALRQYVPYDEERGFHMES